VPQVTLPKRRTLNWFDQAFRHFQDGCRWKRDHFTKEWLELLDPASEHLMYLCLFAYYEPKE
jgi:hypothetical protein